jgi:hypothetical protein
MNQKEGEKKMSVPKRFLCHKAKAERVIKSEFRGQIFAAQSRKADGTTRRWVAKVAKTEKRNINNPSLLVRDMKKSGAYRRMDLSDLTWVANKHREIYFYD